MKLLLDEQLPRHVAGFLPESWTVRTLQQMRWQGTTNGALLAVAAADSFNAMITADKNIEYQQSDRTLPIA